MPTAGWKGKLEYSTDSGSTWTEMEMVQNANPNLPVAEHNDSVFGDEGERRNMGRFDATFDVSVLFDLAEATHTEGILDAVRDEDEYPWRVYPDRNTSTHYFQATCKVFDLSGDISGGSNNTASFSVKNSDGNKWTYSNS